MVRHIDVLGILFVAYGVLQALVGAGVVLVQLLVGIGVLGAGARGGDQEAVVVGLTIGGISLLIGALVLVSAALPIGAGIGIRRRAPWGRILGFVAAVLALSSFPLGTALGVFAFVVLLDKEVVDVFKGHDHGTGETG